MSRENFNHISSHKVGPSTAKHEISRFEEMGRNHPLQGPSDKVGPSIANPKTASTNIDGECDCSTNPTTASTKINEECNCSLCPRSGRSVGPPSLNGSAASSGASSGASLSPAQSMRMMIMKPSSPVSRSTKKYIEKLLPRGLIIMARKTNHLRRGFPYPKLLLQCGITKAQWKLVCKALVATLDPGWWSYWREHRGIAYELEKVLDIAAALDQKFFRPKGLVMRLDSKYIVFHYSKHSLRRT
jgi:hypothetical protein